jgi:hypothetical protein
MSLDGPEFETRRRSGVLPAWLEWVTSISALVVSVCSIFIAVHNGHDADKALQAQTYPYLELGRSDSTPEGEKRLSIEMINEGVGPAHEESFRIKVGDRYVTSLDSLIATAVGGAAAKAARAALDPLSSGLPTRFIPANSSQFVLRTTRTDANARWWDAFDKASQTWTLEVCYCSVFGECWKRINHGPTEPVKACRRDEATEYRN